MVNILHFLGKIFSWAFLVPGIYFLFRTAIHLRSNNMSVAYSSLNSTIFFLGVMMAFASLREDPPPKLVLYTSGVGGLIVLIISIYALLVSFPMWQGFFVFALGLLTRAKAASENY